MYNENIIDTALEYTRVAVSKKISNLINEKRDIGGSYPHLYKLLSDYPFRKGKGLRPAILLSIARAIGGVAQCALLSGAALEMYHNAFLIHDDIEDDSEIRRGKDTLHGLIGTPRAINIGDATNVLALSFLLENLSTIGVTKSLYVMHEVENMARQSVEGQAMELDWIANNTFGLTDSDYFTMCAKKTCWYTFIAPCRIGYITGCNDWEEQNAVDHLVQLTEFGMSLGIAFQIQDDLLNILGDVKKYGKEINGDIYECKRTIMLNHLILHSGSSKDHIKEIITKPRKLKKEKEIKFILNEMRRCGSIEYGKELANKFAKEAKDKFDKMTFLKEKSPVLLDEIWECEYVDKRFISNLVNYVTLRKL